MSAVPIIQFVRPNAVERYVTCDVADDVRDRYKLVLKPLGLRLTAECVSSDLVSLCIEEPDLGDFCGVLAENTPRNPGIVREALEAMIRRFDAEEFAAWKAKFNEEE